MVITNRKRSASLRELQIDRQKATDATMSPAAIAIINDAPGNVNQRLATWATLKGFQKQAKVNSAIVSRQAARLTSRPNVCVVPLALYTSHAEPNKAQPDTIAMPQSSGNRVIVYELPKSHSLARMPPG
jgi:hypothetical protein